MKRWDLEGSLLFLLYALKKHMVVAFDYLCVRMLGTESLLIDAQGLLVERFGLPIATLGLIEAR